MDAVATILPWPRDWPKRPKPLTSENPVSEGRVASGQTWRLELRRVLRFRFEGLSGLIFSDFGVISGLHWAYTVWNLELFLRAVLIMMKVELMPRRKPQGEDCLYPSKPWSFSREVADAKCCRVCFCIWAAMCPQRLQSLRLVAGFLDLGPVILNSTNLVAVPAHSMVPCTVAGPQTQGRKEAQMLVPVTFEALCCEGLLVIPWPKRTLMLFSRTEPQKHPNQSPIQYPYPRAPSRETIPTLAPKSMNVTYIGLNPKPYLEP